MTSPETAEDIEEAAFAWIARLDRAPGDLELEAEAAAWRAADPRREGAFLRAQAIWLKLDRASQSESARPNVFTSQLTRRAAVAAGLAITAAGAASLVMASGKSMSTLRGEVRRVSMPDGSVMELNTQSRVHIAMSNRHRVLHLDQGEAWFHVFKDPQRPFVVEIGRARVQAIGTAFSVRRRDEGVEVLVTEGVVEAWAEGASSPHMRLPAGQKGFIREDAPVLARLAAPEELERRLAWRAGRIDLAGETLSDAVAEFNRYNSRKIVVTDETLTSKRFFGVFRVDDPEGFARSVHQSLGAPVSISADTIVIG